MSVNWAITIKLSNDSNETEDMEEDKIYWRPATKCCWHAFVLKRGKLVSLCGTCCAVTDENEKTTRPPVFFRCAACNAAERGKYRDRNLPPTQGWENLVK